MFLINKGSDINRIGVDGITPLLAILRINYSAPDLKNKDFHDQMAIFQILLQMGADVNKPRESVSYVVPGHTPLSGALEWVTSYHPQRVPIWLEMLLEKGADVNTIMLDRRACTIVHFASQLGYTDVVAYLLNHRADIEAQDCDGKTPLEYAVSLSW